jgi:hypothetical protein
MHHASPRRSFHGPLFTLVSDARKPRKLEPAAAAFELLPTPPSESSVGRAVLEVARREQPSTGERERILAGVLAALQRLTAPDR